MKNLHTFVICAYKESPYLDECVKSLLNQTIKSNVIISTSTPNEEVKKIAENNNVKLVINTGKGGHIEDFCFAYNQVNTKYVSLCHQDDIYLPDFGLETVKRLEKSKRPLIAFTNYYDYKNGQLYKTNKLLKVKRLMNLPLLIPGFKKLKWVRKLILSFGNPISAPTVTYNKEVIVEPIIKSEFKANIDWDTYIKIADMKGSFVYLAKPLLHRRIHELSTTTNVLQDNTMRQENLAIFKRFWPDWFAKKLLKIYSKSEENNKL